MCQECNYSLHFLFIYDDPLRFALYLPLSYFFLILETKDIYLPLGPALPTEILTVNNALQPGIEARPYKYRRIYFLTVTSARNLSQVGNVAGPWGAL